MRNSSLVCATGTPLWIRNHKQVLQNTFNMSWLNQFSPNYPRQTSHLVQNCLPLLLLWQCCPTLGLEVTCTSLSVSPWPLNPTSNTTRINDLLFLRYLRDPTVYNTWSSSQKEWTYSLCTDHVSNCLIKSVNLDENKINIVYNLFISFLWVS